MRLTVPEGYVPSDRSKEVVRENIANIPWMMLSNPYLNLETRETLRTAWWEEILMNQIDNDHEEALRIDRMRNMHSA